MEVDSTVPTSGAVDPQVLALQARVKELEASFVIAETNYDHQTQWLEVQNRQFATELASVKQQLEQEREAAKEKERALTECRESLSRRDEQMQNNHDPTLGVRVESLEAEKRDLAMIVSKRQLEIERLTAESEAWQQQLHSLRAELRTTNNKATELETENMKDKLVLTGKEQEIAQARKTSEWLNSELQKKSEEFAAFRLEKIAQSSELQNKVDTLIQEKSALESKNRFLQQKTDGLEQKVQDLYGKLNERESRLIQNEQQFKKEMDAQKRLAEIYEKKLKDDEKHLLELQRTLTEAQEDWDNEKQMLEQKIQELELETTKWRDRADELYESNDRLQHQLKQCNEGGPRDELPEGSKSSETSRVTLRGMTYTTLYASFEEEKQRRVEVERELEITRERFTEAYERLESLGPFMQELEVENTKLQERNSKLFADLSRALEEKKAAVGRCTIAEADIIKATEEKRMLEQDVRDLVRQVQAFCIQLQQARPGSPDDFERYLQELTKRYSAGESFEESPTDALISQRLVEVKSLEELVQQNVDLRRTARNLARQLEESQKKLETQKSELVTVEITKARAKIEELEESTEKLSRQLRFVVKQRNDLRAVIEGRGNAAQLTPRNHISDGPATPNTRRIDNHGDGEYERLYRELQQDFDNYVRETGTSSKDTSRELERLRQEKSDLAIQVAKLNTQLEYQSDHYQRLAQTADGQLAEIAQYRQTITNMTTAATQQDAKTQELTNSIMAERLRAEQLSSQVQQLKIERQVWESSKDRALKEAKDLLSERNFANERVQVLQRQLEDREESWRAEKRRLEDKLDTAEKELSVIRKQLHEALESNRALLARKDAEVRAATLKIERLTAENEKTKGELLLAQNKHEHLSERAADLTSRLNTAESKLATYEGVGDAITTTSAEDKVRALEKELVDTKRTMAALTEDLERAREREANMKELAEANEKQWVESTETYDTYRNEKEKEIQELHQRIQTIESERNEILEQMKSTDRELIEAREKLESENVDHEEKLRSLEAEIERIKQSEATALKAQGDMQQIVERHARIAEQANESYEREVVAHSNALQATQQLKDQQVKLKGELSEYQQRATVAEATLRTAETSWGEIKRKLGEEIEAAQRRIEDLQTQNELLHSQFDRMQEGQKLSDALMETGNGHPTADAERVIKELRELVKYAKNERDILQTKLDIALSENNRFRLEMSHLQSTLDETRARLDEERRRSQDALQDDKRHKELMDKIEQANLLRESNVTLRDQVEQSAKKIKEYEEKLRATVNECEPLREQVATLQTEVEAQKKENTTLNEDNKRWRDRVEQILRKYQKIDPHDYEQLKRNVENITKEKEEAVKAKEEITAKLANFEETNKKLREIAHKQKAGLDNRSKQIADLTAQLATLSAKEAEYAEKDKELNALKEQLADPEKNEAYVTLRAEADKKRAEIVQQANTTLMKFKERNKTLTQELGTFKQQNAALQQQLSVAREELAKVNTQGGATAGVPERIQQLEQQLAQVRSESDTRISTALEEWKTKNNGEMDALKLRKQLLESQLASEKRRVTGLNERIKQLEGQIGTVYNAPAEGQTTTQVAIPTDRTAAGPPVSLVVPVLPQGAKRQREEEEEGATHEHRAQDLKPSAATETSASSAIPSENGSSEVEGGHAAKRARLTPENEISVSPAVLTPTPPAMTEVNALVPASSAPSTNIPPSVQPDQPLDVGVIATEVPAIAQAVVPADNAFSAQADINAPSALDKTTEGDRIITTEVAMESTPAEENEGTGDMGTGEMEPVIEELAPDVQGEDIEDTDYQVQVTEPVAEGFADEGLEDMADEQEGGASEASGPQVEDVTEELEQGILEQGGEALSVPEAETSETGGAVLEVESAEKPETGAVTEESQPEQIENVDVTDTSVVEQPETTTAVIPTALSAIVQVPTSVISTTTSAAAPNAPPASTPATTLNPAAVPFQPTNQTAFASTPSPGLSLAPAETEDPAARAAALKRKLQAAQAVKASAGTQQASSELRIKRVRPTNGAEASPAGTGQQLSQPISPIPGASSPTPPIAGQASPAQQRGRGRGIRRVGRPGGRYRGGAAVRGRGAVGARGRGQPSPGQG